MRRFYEHVWTCSLTADSPECLLHSIACLHHGRLLREKLFEAIFEFNRILPGNVRKNREHVHIFSHLLSYLSSSTAFYNYHLLQFCISAVRLFSLLRPFSPCFRRAFKACLCYILHHLASSCQLWHLWYSNHSNAKHPSIGSVCLFVCSVLFIFVANR